MENVSYLTFASSLTALREINSSFDSGILRVAYHGVNRNRSYISKETFEKCIKTLYNVPVVCNYIREDDALGGHDMEVVRYEDGSVRLVNLTEPVGCVPLDAKYFWESVAEDNGQVHEYLCIEVLIWKRQEAYRKIKSEGVVNQSMEITIKDGEMIDGLYHIYDFEFTALALIGVEPCFESAALAFSKENFKQQFSQMMLEIKECFKDTNAEMHVDINNFAEGGTKLDKNELLEKYGVTVESLDFSIEELTYEELDEKLAAMMNPPEKPSSEEEKFELVSNITKEVSRVIDSQKMSRVYDGETSEVPKYFIVDFDIEKKEVYCWDREDWLLYGFTYELNGDAVSIDFECKKRKKYAIVDFEGEETQDSPFMAAFNEVTNELEKAKNNATLIKNELEVKSAEFNALNDEVISLREFKANVEKLEENARNEKMFEMIASFSDLAGIEAYELFSDEVHNDPSKFTLESVEDKCFAIRGRMQTAKFSAQKNTVPVLPIDRSENKKMPYGGVFEEFGIL